ncbi:MULTISPECIES: ABC transporter permease [Xanthomonas]|uniref:ABC transporter permease n=1 Tax=Xanthomonas hortorum pv. carotae TaxID=487904 RepID=A0A6V7EZ02_9XANT|nr:MULTISPECIES: ABC transporter permease [Xanthomonas]MEA9747830.1 ABC transporter permease [Xanthomonas campestris pv. raphani]MEA9765662.1 ABC transporter permease [Xanthomonas campestris pv. raphani]MEA9817878.1 ABC transporter permease [Xanthomonas campestris pv. raphani]MEA9849577.1 ABC transporter permease [Xanthomonas campestris pv. raphani]MEA9911124.1 ABC transporter permease [Xanthomonas campestris pv. raphani]
MFSYYLTLAKQNLLASKAMTLALVVALALGVGASMTMLTVVRVLSWDPMPGRSAYLFHPYFDPLPRSYEAKASLDPRNSVTWVDAKEIMRRLPAPSSAAMATGHLLVVAQDGVDSPFFVDGQYATPGIFHMFGINLSQGRSWTDEEEQSRAALVVISESFRKRLGQAGEVGKSLQLGAKAFRIVGISRDWAPKPRFHTDLQKDIFKGQDDFYIPLHTAIDDKLSVSSSMFSWARGDESNKMESPSTAWLQLWVYLDQAAQQRYLEQLQSYVEQQADAGRFERRSPARLEGLEDFLIRRQVVPDDVKLQLALAIGFLIVCMVNICALLFSRFIRRTHEVAVRRALGARRIDIMAQLCTESLLIGALGGLGALVVCQVGLSVVRAQPEDYAALAHLDLTMVAATLAFACLSSLAAAAFPAIRTASGRMAMQIKVAE